MFKGTTVLIWTGTTLFGCEVLNPGPQMVIVASDRNKIRNPVDPLCRVSRSYRTVPVSAPLYL